MIPAELSAHVAHVDFTPRVLELIADNGFRRVCDIGGGRSPTLSPADVKRLGLDYIVMDVSRDELDLAPRDFEKVVADVCTVDESTLANVDFAFSHMVAEHVPDGTAMHRQIFRILRPGGMAFHMFPTLYYPVFVVNRVIPNSVADALTRRLYPGKKRFPARYSKCFGPTPSMFRLLRGIGYEVVEYRPFYGTGYFAGRPLLERIDHALGGWAAARANTHLTSYVWLLLKKPEATR
jgi:hypothetical protein